MDMTRFQRAAQWLTVSTIDHVVHATIKDVRVWRDVTGDSPYLVVVEDDTATEWNVRLNQTSLALLVDAYGADSERWLNMPVTVMAERVKTKRGTVLALIVRPVELDVKEKFREK